MLEGEVKGLLGDGDVAVMMEEGEEGDGGGGV